MYKFIHSLFFPLLFLPSIFCSFQHSVVQLDTGSFDKIIAAFPHVLVKFDVNFPTGTKHNTYGDLAKQLQHVDDILVAEVRVKDFGDKANQDLADRCQVKTSKENLPELILYSNVEGERKEVRYGGDFTINNLRKFVSSKTGLWLALPGCVKEMDHLAARFGKEETVEGRKMILEEAKRFTGGEKGEDYVKIMKAALEEGQEAIDKEEKRVISLMQGKISKKNKEDFSKKLNIIQSFTS